MMFFTILSVVFGVGALLRLIGILANNDPHTAQLIRLAEAAGGNPVGDAARTPLIIFAVCLCYWLYLLIELGA